ncbi:MAG: beta galactosidase jelly roll domain-containing protein, partial [Ignavibacteriales bacterium]|nr:beta galactosidase jelly roll domain-containing protein [Ignavibacteriales bacterium]
KIDLAGAWNYSIDGKTWSSVSVPSAYDFAGKVVFRRTFEVKAEMLDRYTFFVVGYGINYQSEININGNFIGRHTGGYSSFVLPIQPNILQVGSENAIRISVDNELTPKTTLPLRQQIGGWRTYGGIFRDIYILATPKLYVENMDVQPEIVNDAKGEVKLAKVFVSTDITDRGSGAQSLSGGLLGFQVEAYDKLSNELVGRSGISPISVQVNKSVSINAEVILAAPKLWFPEAPDLYILKCEIVRVVNKEVTLLDEFDSNVGIRDLRWKDGHLYINNIQTPLKGILWQGDHSTFGSAMTYEALERDIASIKALGANLVRFLCPPHPYMLNLCDRYGLLVMEEIPVVGVPAEILSKDYYVEIATTYAKEMVERDKLHVSLLAWGIGDEFETTAPNSCDYVNVLRNIIKAIDQHSVYFATRYVNDPCFEYADLIAVNNYGGDVKGFRDALKRCKAQHPDKPILVSRYGRDVEPGNHNGYSDPLSMESQARYALQCYEAIKDAKVAGSVLWSFNDWRTDRAALTTHADDPYLHTTGIVSYEREKRTAFDIVRAMFNGEKSQALPVGNYSSNAPIIFVLAGFVALVSFAFIYNGNRRFRECVNRSLFRTYNFFADVRDQRILTYAHSIFLAAIVSVTWATLLSSIFSHYRENLLLDNLLSQFMSDGVKEWFIHLVWNPLKFILVISGIIFLKLLVLALMVRLFSMMVRTHVYFYHAFSITMWSLLPYIVLIPIAMILYRLMETEFYIVPVFVVVGITSIWVLVRLLKGISIIYDVFPMKVYAVSILVIVVATAAVYGYLDYTKSTTVYLKYMVQSLRTSV